MAEARVESTEQKAAEQTALADAVLRETEELDFNDLDDLNTNLNQQKRDFQQYRNRLVGERNLLNQKVKVHKDLIAAERRLKDEQSALVAQRDEAIKQLEIANETLKRDLRERTDLMAAKDTELGQAMVGRCRRVDETVGRGWFNMST